MSNKEEIIKKLSERHKLYVGISEKEISENPYWQLSKPLSGKELNEWVEFGVNTIMSELRCDRTQAEIEMSWIHGTYPVISSK